jgi:single-strand DNA-binding protein
MSLASNRYYKQETGFEREVSYFDVETWSKLAEACYSKGRKGRGVRVVGRLKQDRWNSPDGKAHSRITIVAEHVEFRPDFKKDENAKSNAGVNEQNLDDTPYENNYPDEETDEPVLAAAEKELEPVTF